MKLSREAMLLNTPSFIIKVSLSMFFAFFIGRYIPFVKRDMISFLFGLVLSLEPVNITGYKRGFDQFIATLVGGCITGIITAFIGITPLGLALSMVFVLYYTLRKNWREMSVVAIFTTIYMTQYVQLTVGGQPDIAMTLLVRTLSLTAGILFAMTANIITSFIVSPNFANRRIHFLNYRLNQHLERIITHLNTDATLKEKDYESMALMFKDIDWTIGLLNDFSNDPTARFRNIKKSDTLKHIETAKHIRVLSHYLSDIQLQLKDSTTTCTQKEVKLMTAALMTIKNNDDLDTTILTPLATSRPRIYDDLIRMLRKVKQA